MFSTKDGKAAIREFIKSGGAMRVSIGETDTFFVGDTAELADMGDEYAKQSTATAIYTATRNWSLDAINEELGAACHYSQHNELHEAREALVAMLTKDFVTDEPVEQYSYRTDGEHGFLHARNFAEAKQMLREIVTDEAIEDGGWGWVDDVDGCRYEFGSRD